MTEESKINKEEKRNQFEVTHSRSVFSYGYNQSHTTYKVGQNKQHVSAD